MTDTVVTIPAPPDTSAKWPGAKLWHDSDGFGFHDLLDTINPLQHVPIVGSIYRAVTGDESGAVARVVGDGLFGGIYGLASGLVNVLVQAESGKDIGDHVMTWLGLEDDKSSPGTPTKTAGGGLPAGGHSGMPLSPSRYLLPTSASLAADAPAGNAPPSGPTLNQKPIPLRGTGLLLPNSRPRPLSAPPGPVSTAAALPPTAAALAATGVVDLPSGGLPNARLPNAAAGASGPMTTPASTGSIVPTPLGNAGASGNSYGGIAVKSPTASGPGDATSASNPSVARPPVAGNANRTAAAPSVPAGTPSATPQAAPVEISQKMSEALDKYARMMKQRHGADTGAVPVNLIQ